MPVAEHSFNQNTCVLLWGSTRTLCSKFSNQKQAAAALSCPVLAEPSVICMAASLQDCLRRMLEQRPAWSGF